MSKFSREIHKTLMGYPEFRDSTPLRTGERTTIKGIDNAGNAVVIDQINDGECIFVAVDTLLQSSNNGLVKTTLDYLKNNDGTFDAPELLTSMTLTNESYKDTGLTSLAELYVELREELELDPKNENIKEKIVDTVSLMHQIIVSDDYLNEMIDEYDDEKHKSTIKYLGRLMLL